ncbi:MAG: hypothetical protein ACI8X5_003655 [Planctomycetota bacterium]|jgi:uncharacterized protein (DUF1501 family)
MAPLKSTAGSNPKTLIVVYLRGGADGLSLVAPTNDPIYISSRGPAAIPPSSVTTPNETTYLTDYFDLAPAAKDLASIYTSGRLAFSHVTGLPNQVLSHFDAQDYMETGTDLEADPIIQPTDGWLGRFLSLPGINQTTNLTLSGIHIGTAASKTIFGSSQSVPIADPRFYALPLADALVTVGGSPEPAREYFLENSYADGLLPQSTPQTIPQLVAEVGTAALGAIDIMAQVDFDETTYDTYWDTIHSDIRPIVSITTQHPFARQLWSAAQLVKANCDVTPQIDGLGLQAITIDFSGWDDHVNLDPLARNLLENGFYSRQRFLCQALAAFEDELNTAGCGDDYVLVVMSEFGRRITINGSLGFDHGRGNCWIVMGCGVQGQQVFSDGWEASADITTVTEDSNLTIRIDMQDLLAEILIDNCGLDVNDIDKVFPGKTPVNYDPPGIIA